MATNASNSVKANFYRQFKRYLRHRHQLNGEQAYNTLNDIFATEYEGDDEIVWIYRDCLPRNEEGKVIQEPHLLIPIQYEFLRYFEEHHPVEEYTQESKQLRLFSLIPYKKGFGCSHFKMCKTGFWALLKRYGIWVPDLGPRWNAIADEIWRWFFNIEKFETKNRKFAGEITTDGKSVSILLRKPKREEVAPPKLNRHDYDEIWGLDPGRRDMFVAVTHDGKKISCSTKEYYEDARFKKSNQTTRYWQDCREDVLEAIRNMPTKKTASLKQLKKYVEFMIPRMDLLLDFYMKKPFRKLKLRKYIFAQKKLRELCLKLTEEAGYRTLVGFGDWSNQDVGGFIKKSSRGPVKRFERMLKRYCTVVSIDEYRTSKVHSDASWSTQCDKEMVNQVSLRMCKDGIERPMKVHSVLHCKSNGCCGMTVNRDVNAAQNILYLLQCKLYGLSRPPIFCRGRT